MIQERNDRILAALNNCTAACLYCASSCLDEKSVGMLIKCIRLDLDCAGICRLAADFIARGSDHQVHILKECVEICDACAAECEKHAAHGMEHCRLCAEACRLCAEICREVAGR